MACTLAESPCDPLYRRLRQLRCLRCRFDCYRVERTSSRAGVAPAEVQRLFTAHFHATYPRRGEESVSVGPIIRQVTGGIRYPYVRYNDHRRPPGAASGQRSHRMVTQCTETLLAKGDDSSR